MPVSPVFVSSTLTPSQQKLYQSYFFQVWPTSILHWMPWTTKCQIQNEQTNKNTDWSIRKTRRFCASWHCIRCGLIRTERHINSTAGPQTQAVEVRCLRGRNLITPSCDPLRPTGSKWAGDRMWRAETAESFAISPTTYHHRDSSHLPVELWRLSLKLPPINVAQAATLDYRSNERTPIDFRRFILQV